MGTLDKQELLKRIRRELGSARSCALMLANTQAGDTRSRYLKSLNEKLKEIETLLEKLPAAPDA